MRWSGAYLTLNLIAVVWLLEPVPLGARYWAWDMCFFIVAPFCFLLLMQRQVLSRDWFACYGWLLVGIPLLISATAAMWFVVKLRLLQTPHPLWFIAVLFAGLYSYSASAVIGLFFALLVRKQRSLEVEQGLFCDDCGYRIDCSPSLRCPECGKPRRRAELEGGADRASE